MNHKPGIFDSWQELWVLVLNVVGLIGLLAGILYGLPIVYALVRQ